jgi:hypothetical protein
MLGMIPVTLRPSSDSARESDEKAADVVLKVSPIAASS